MPDRITRIRTDLQLIFRYWWAVVVGLVISGLGTLATLGIELAIPLWAWAFIAVSGFFAAMFLALHRRGTELAVVIAEKDALVSSTLATEVGPTYKMFDIQNSRDIHIFNPQQSIGPPEPVEEDLKSDFIKGRTVDIVMVPRIGGLIEGKTFEDCTIRGPAILMGTGDNNHMDNCTFDYGHGDADSIMWFRTRLEEFVVGAIGLRNCTFRRCVFVGIGIGVRKDSGLPATIRAIPPKRPN
jgi:hypothetical protein